MKTATLVIKNETGLHARPAATVINKAKEFESKLTVRKGNKEVNLKSMISLLSLGICKGEEIHLTAEGIDEEVAIEDLSTFILELAD